MAEGSSKAKRATKDISEPFVLQGLVGISILYLGRRTEDETPSVLLLGTGSYRSPCHGLTREIDVVRITWDISSLINRVLNPSRIRLNLNYLFQFTKV